MFTPLVQNDHVLVDGGLVNPLPVNIARQLGADFIIAVDVTRSPLAARDRSAVKPAAASRPRQDTTTGPPGAVTRKLLDRLNAKLHSFDFTDLPIARRRLGREDLPNIFEIYGNAMRIIQQQVTTMRLKLEPADILIQPDVQDIRTMDFHRAEDAIQAGYEAAWAALYDGA